MHAPVNWTELIIEAEFEIKGIVLSGTVGLEFIMVRITNSF